MSIQFNDTTTLKGIAQIYEKEIGANQGDITGNTTKLKSFTADANLALDDYTAIALQASGTWQFDDSNQTDYPIITTNLVSGQRDYSFTTDEGGNLILDIYKVLVLQSATGTVYSELFPVDQQSDYDATGFTDGQNITGTPTTYDKTANGIFLDAIPGYNATKGLKVYINRESSYFTYSDTTKKPGVPGLHHKYFALKPALDYARRNNLATLPRLEQEVAKMERDIKEYFGRREKDTRNILTMDYIQFR
jgi:hypothetical protein